MNKDMLTEIFLRQKELMDKYHKIESENGLLQTDKCPVDIDDPFGQARLKDFAWRITEELAEAMHVLKNRSWKKTWTKTDREAYTIELIDAFHFFVELCILSGIEAEDLHKFYFMKSQINISRQKEGY